MSEPQVASAPTSERLTAARSRAQERLHRQRQTLRPLGWVAVVTVALGAVTAAAGSSSSAVAAGTLVTVLLGVVAQFLKQSGESQNQTELLLAQLEDARDEQVRAAAIAERGRIASELHDVLARRTRAY